MTVTVGLKGKCVDREVVLHLNAAISFAIIPPITPSFRLHIRQQPVHARQCGFGTKDFRPIDPVPIIQMLPMTE